RAAQKRGQRASTAHLLLVMLQRGGDAGALLSEVGVRESDLLSALKVVDPESSSTLERTLERSTRLANRFGHPQPDGLHLLLAITRDARSAAHRSLRQMGMGTGPIQNSILARLQVEEAPVTSGRGELRSPSRNDPQPERRSKKKDSEVGPKPPLGRRAKRKPTPPRPSARRDPSKSVPPPPPNDNSMLPLGPFDLDPMVFPVLTGLARNLTALAHDGAFDPVIGRDREIDLLLDVLGRRRSNNPVLVGAPGVGKTAIVEGLAQRLAEGVRGLEGRIVLEISAGALVSGTGVRGALSEKLRRLRDEVAQSGGRVVLFIDEIHAIVSGNEGGGGPDDLAHELKAALARGELPCIGATTEREYRRCFERDAALARRFSAIHVGEPSEEDTIAILAGVLPRYETHHGVRYDEDAARSAVELSVRFLAERRLPDKAIGVLDLAAARVRRRGGEVVDRAAVAGVIAEQALVPVDRLLMRDGERLLRLEALLGERVVGHSQPIAAIADALRKGAAGLRGQRPLGTFLFLGPTGVGKTETAKAISDVFFGAPMTRIDMSEMGESHTVARMLGAPPGYVGHGDGGQLTEAVRNRPYQLLLLDEIEKAHPEVLLSLLPLLDEGRMTDGKGRTVDFTNTIIVMTSNLGAQEGGRRRLGFGDEGEQSLSARVVSAAMRSLPPELWNRIDEPLYFGPLGRAEVAEIAGRMLHGLSERLQADPGITLSVDASAIDALIDAGGYDPAFGARPMRRVVGRLVESPLAAKILAGEFGPGDTVTLRGEGERVLLAK
ncbi:MAG: ATP-dependent Clp protease ATP-binding subunit, partial [Myxococcota bacterium]